MRKYARLSLALTLATIVCVGESSACWLRSQVCRRQHCRLHGPQPACNVPVVYAQPVPVASYVTPYVTSYVTATAQAPSPAPAASAHVLAAPGARVKTFIFKGKTHRAIPTDERGESEEKELRENRRRGPNDGEHFAGAARKAAKTSFAAAPVERFASPGALLDSILQGSSPGDNDQQMRGNLNEDSPRSAPERRNVTVTAFLYATKKEADNDFHLLIGGDPNDGTGRYMTSEVSGLPNPDDAMTPAFQKVRDQYKAFFASTGQELPGDRYVRFDPPVPVTITGSIFFDVDHEIGEVRSGNIVPETVWEIHPVSDIQFGSSGG